MSGYNRIYEFTASSGNDCRLKVWPVFPDGTQPVEGTWERDASLDDVKEFEEWYKATIATRATPPAKLPLRLDLAGGWLDVPRFAMPVQALPIQMDGGYVVNVAISPLVELHERNGATMMRWIHEFGRVVPPGSGLGTSAAWHMLHGRDVDAQEAAQGAGWQDAAIIRQTGLCVWASGATPSLKYRSNGDMLAGKLAIRWTGHEHHTLDLAELKRDYNAIARASTLAYLAILRGNLEQLADAINATYDEQLREGMDELPAFPGGVRNIGIASKYCGAGWGGFGMYLFESAELRDDACRKHGIMPVEPYYG